ncbi:hypothetical protein [Methanobrevibacter sp.]|jgi:hypothetical protein|nr:hypothetical protein [uncultured Methanobrevibacter sp.]
MKGKTGEEKTMRKKEINGKMYVAIPKKLWDRMWEILDRIEEICENLK